MEHYKLKKSIFLKKYIKIEEIIIKFDDIKIPKQTFDQQKDLFH